MRRSAKPLRINQWRPGSDKYMANGLPSPDVFTSARVPLKDSLQKNPLWKAVGDLIYRTNLNRTAGDFIRQPGRGKDTPVAVKKSRPEFYKQQYESRVPAKKKFLGEITNDNDPDWVALQAKKDGNVLGTIIALRGGGMIVVSASDKVDEWLKISEKDKAKMKINSKGLLELKIDDVRELDQVTQDAIKTVINDALSTF